MFSIQYASAFLAKFAAMFGLVSMQVLVARFTGVEEFGSFTAIFIGLTLSGIISRFGCENYLMKYAAVLSSSGDSAKLMQFIVGVVKNVSRNTLILVVCVLPLLFIFDVVDKRSLLVLPVLLLFYNLTFITSYAMKAIGFPVRASLVEFGISGGLAAVSIFVLNIYTETVLLYQVFVILLVCTVLIAVIGLYLISLYVKRKNPQAVRKAKTQEYTEEELVRSRKDYFLSTFATYCLQWVAPLYLLFFNSKVELGLYNSAYTLTMSIGFFMLVMASIVSPRIAILHSRSDSKAVGKLYQKSTLLMVFLSAPVLFAMLIFPDLFLRLYGNDFVSAVPALQILAISQFINVAFGATAPMLNMTQHSLTLRRILLSSLVLSLTVSLVLVPEYGLVGASLTVLITTVFQNMQAVIAIHQKLKLNLVTGYYDK